MSTRRITAPYLLVLFGVPFHMDAEGRRSLDPLWAKDLIEHTRYIDRLTLAAPCRRSAVAPTSNVPVESLPGLAGVQLVDLPAPNSFVEALRALPCTMRILWRELRSAQLVHTAVAGWPIPEAWLLVPLLALRKRLLYVNVESAFWRMVPGRRAPLARRLRAAVTERLNRFCIERADLATFTHGGYKRTLLRRHPERGHVVEASWIDESCIRSEEERVAVRRDRPPTSADPLRLVYAGRLNHEKGVGVLIRAVGAALQAGVPVALDLYGQGPVEQDCRDLIAAGGWGHAIRLRGSIDYGPAFFAMLGRHEAVVVPSITDEQPRIVYDAYAQGLPAIASRTEGLVQCVDDGTTGLLFPPGDAKALEALIVRLAADPSVLAAMGMACLQRARNLTHQRMHRARNRLLVEQFPQLSKVIAP